MWKLTIEDDEGTKTLLPLVRDEYQLGRDEKNTIRLTERNISRHHALLKKNGGGAWHLVDGDGQNPSYNGVYVNGQRVAGATKLQHSDLIQVGDYRIFISDDAQLIDENAPTNAVPGQPARPTSPSMAMSMEKPDRLIVVAGPEPGREWFIDQIPSVTIGRAEDCTVSINHPSVSRVHCEIKPLGGGRYEVFDRGSSNGVRVNGHDLRRGLLEGGDLIELGDVKLRFLEKGQHSRTADASQQIDAVTSRPAASVRPAAKKGGATLLVGIAIGVVLASVIGFVALRGGESEKTAATPPTQVDPGQKLLADALKARAAGDYDGALAALAQIPDSSPAKKDPQAQKIYADWADFMIRQGQDPKTEIPDRRDALKKVAQNTAIDADRRKQAADLLQKLDSSGGADVKGLPTATAAPSDTKVAQPTAQPTIDLDQGSRTVADTSPTPVAKHEPRDTGDKPEKPEKHPKDKPDTASASTTSSPDVTTQDGETKMRKQLEGRAWSGKASPEELKMLKAICKHQGDRACADRANGLLQNK